MWREQQERSGEMVRGRLPGGQVPFGALFFFFFCPLGGSRVAAAAAAASVVAAIAVLLYC